jgi:hypothetical protein
MPYSSGPGGHPLPEVNFLMVEIPSPKPYIFMIRVTRQFKCLIAQAPGVTPGARAIRHLICLVTLSNLFWTREYNRAKEICKYPSFSKVGGNYPLDLKIYKLNDKIVSCNICKKKYFWFFLKIIFQLNLNLIFRDMWYFCFFNFGADFLFNIGIIKNYN